MSAVPTWDEIKASLDATEKLQRAQGWALYRALREHVESEIVRTGAAISMKEQGTTLSKEAGEGALEMRLGVDYRTALYARQPHVAEAPGEKTRSWPVQLDRAPELPAALRGGLTKVIEDVARMQGRLVTRAQSELDV